MSILRSRAIPTIGPVAVWCGVLCGVLCGVVAPGSVAAQIEFAPGATVTIATPESMTKGDFDGDGHLDLAVASTLANQVVVLLGNGLGGFLSSTAIPHGAPFSIVSSDFNGDGDLDLATADVFAGTITVFLGDGNGAFTVSGSYGVGISPWAIAVADFDEDGVLDLAVANHGSDSVTLLRGDGLGAFTNPWPAFIYAGPSHVVAEDFDQNGHVDLAVTSSIDSNFSVRYGDGAGLFPFVLNFSIGIDDSLWSATAHDVTGDGLPDLIFPCPNFDIIALYAALPAGGFLSITPVPCGDQPREALVGDFNLDGNLDIAALNLGSSNLTVSLSYGSGLFAAPLNFSSGPDPVSVLALDLDEDGQEDLIAANKLAGTLTVLLNRTHPDGNFLRGDADGDAVRTIADAVRILTALFGPISIPLQCPDAGDLNDDGVLGIADPIVLLGYLFAGNPAPPPPGPDCAVDPTVDPLPPCGVVVGCL